jgi:glucokinase
MKNRSFVGIDLGGTRIKLGLVVNGSLLARTVLDAEQENGLGANLAKVETAIGQLLFDSGIAGKQLSGVGLSFPGIVDPREKRVLSTLKKYDDAPNLALENWVAEKWNTAFYIENDARMAAVGEWKFGAGRGCDDLVCVTIGTGFGTSAIIGGQLLRGKHFQAGCLGGHLTVMYDGSVCNCGNIGCAEAQASSWNLSHSVRESPDFAPSALSKLEKIDFEAVFRTAREGDSLALRMQNKCMDVWSAAIINLIHAYDPERVIIGGGILNSKDVILPYITERVERYAFAPWGKVALIASQLMDDAAILGVSYSMSQEL